MEVIKYLGIRGEIIANTQVYSVKESIWASLTNHVLKSWLEWELWEVRGALGHKQGVKQHVIHLNLRD